LYVVRELTKAEQTALWPAFVRAQGRYHFTQLPAYQRFLRSCYGYRTVCLGVFEAHRPNELLALLPASVRPRLLPSKKSLISHPFYEYGGWLTSSETTVDGEAFVAALRATMKKRRIASWDVRFNAGCQSAIRERLTITDSVECAELPLVEDPQKMLASIGRAARKAVKRGQKSDLRYARRTDRETLLRFYETFKGHMRRRFGTPPVSRKHFFLLQELYGDDVWLIEVTTPSGEPLAYLYGISAGKRVHLLHTVETEHQQSSLRPADYAHWAMAQLTAARGIEWMDFGFARYEGQKLFKKKWGCRFLDTHDYRLDATEQRGPKKSLLPLPDDFGERAQAFAAKMWQKTPTLGEEWVGHHIRRILCR
jgi:hypothetical protein